MASTISKGRKRQRSSSAPLGCLISAYLIANSCPAPLAPTAVWAFSGKSPTSSAQHIVKICQNKDCRKRFSPRAPDGSLVDTIKDLLPSSSSDNTGNIAIESSGCLSQCGKGPNLCVVEADSGKERLFYGVDSASTAAAILDVACDYDPPVDLIMAADKISKAQIGECGVRVLIYAMFIPITLLVGCLVVWTHTIYRVADECFTYTMPRFRCYLCAKLMSRDPPRLGCNAFGVAQGFVSVPSAWMSVGEDLDLLHLLLIFNTFV